MLRVAHDEPEPRADAARPELGEQDGARTGAARAVADAAHLGGDCAPPAVVAVEVQLVLEDEEAAPLEQRDPVVHRPLHLPALVVVLSRRHADEQAALGREHAVQLAQGGLVARVVARRLDVVDRVVAADVLEGRDAEHQVEGAVGERQLACVGDDGAEARNRLVGEIDADQLSRAERRQPGEIRRLGVGVAEVEHPPFAVVAGEAPRNLDRALVARRGREQLARTRRPAHLPRPRALARRRRRRRRPARPPARTRRWRRAPAAARSGRASRPRAARAPAPSPPGRPRAGRRAARRARRTPRPFRTPPRATHRVRPAWTEARLDPYVSAGKAHLRHRRRGVHRDGAGPRARGRERDRRARQPAPGHARREARSARSPELLLPPGRRPRRRRREGARARGDAHRPLRRDRRRRHGEADARCTRCA